MNIFLQAGILISCLAWVGCSPLHSIDDCVPDGPEVTYDGIDNDCDPATPDDDLDGDGYDSAVDCDDQDPGAVPDMGGRCALGRSCRDILESGLAAGDGTYLIDPDGPGGELEAFEAYCDMEKGGYTLCFSYDTSSYDRDEWPTLFKSRNKMLAKQWGATNLLGEGNKQGNFCNLLDITPGETQLRAEVVKVENSAQLIEATFTLQKGDFFTQIHDQAPPRFDCLTDVTGTRRLMYANYIEPAATINSYAGEVCTSSAGEHLTLTARTTTAAWGTDGFLILSGVASDHIAQNELAMLVNHYKNRDTLELSVSGSNPTVPKFGLPVQWLASGYGRSGPSPGIMQCYADCGHTNQANNVLKPRLWVR